MVEIRKRTPRGWRGRYIGFRVNCESVPLLPAWAVRWVLDDPRKIPYLFVWKSPWTGEVKEATRVTRYTPAPPFWSDDLVEVKRTDGGVSILRFVWRELPRNRGRSLLLTCWFCMTPRGALYGWEACRHTYNVKRAEWACRACAGLRYASEGGALVSRARSARWRLMEALFGPIRTPRPESWYPYVFSSPELAAEAGLCSLKLL